MLLLFSFFALFLCFLNCHALVNVTIDDTNGDPLTGALIAYSPQAAWTEPGNLPCTLACPPTTPNVQDMSDWTYHNSTFSPNSGKFPNVPLTATVQFNGSAVYVYCALSRSPNANSDMTFFLDGVVVGQFIKTPVGSAGFDYGVPVYANSSIDPGLHTLTLQNGQQNGVESVMILDSIVYTSTGNVTAAQEQAPSTSSTSSTQRGPSRATLAVVAVLVITLVVILMILGVCLYRRRRRRRAVYATYMPKGTVRAFPVDAAPSRPMSAITPLPPVYAGGSGGNWWVGRDQKSRDGLRAMHRPYMDLDPSQAALQHPPAWESNSSYRY
ncbi:hypothetical protein MSAN_00793000 [Mycena sanguinolenta]|uniref:Transmembrane protein n=1 Tax=Mycena sanguinolenta TaxID=230812 RepID=A0A8H6YYX9_9AGAR|nr:hypothetical protein MSAN_00793000 [Mycena sanguinolenta]